MELDRFVKALEPFILEKELHTEELPLENGLRLLLPSSGDGAASVFIGELAEWNRVMQAGCFCPDSVYLICTDRTANMRFHLPSRNDVSVIFFHLSLQRLYRILSHPLENILPSDPFSVKQECLLEFFQLLKNGELSTPAEIDFWMKQLPYPIKTFLAVLVLRPDAEQYHLPAEKTYDALSGFFPDTNLFLYHDEWIVLFSQEEQGSDDIRISYDAFEKLPGQLHMSADISYIGVIPGSIYTLYQTALTSLELGKKVPLTMQYSHIFPYAIYNTLYIVHLCARQYVRDHGQSSLYYLAYPDMVRIYLYDKDHNSDLLDTIYAYLINGSSLTRTARKLYMHRNTIASKLAKIESIIGFSLNEVTNNSNFILSYVVLRYGRDYLGTDIS